MENTLCAAAFGMLFCAMASAQAAAAVDIQFSGTPAQTGAAVIGSRGDFWNEFDGGSLSNQSLLTTAGGASGLELSFSSDQSYTSDPSYDAFSGTPYASLMRTYLVGRVGSNDIGIDLSGFSAGHAYGFYVYTQGDDNSARRSIGISANGMLEATTTQSNAGGFIVGDNYTYFQAVADSAGDIDLSGPVLAGAGNINGLQIVSGVPETSSTWMLAAGLAALGASRLRRRAAAR
jgi:hypothetical protein